MNTQLLHTPEGVRDLYGQEYARKLSLQSLLHEKMNSYGYQDIQTPMFEFFDVFSKEIGTTPSKELYKFYDKDGNTLVLRPDFTPSIARCAAKYFMDEATPIRLCYQGNTFTNTSNLQGKLKEVTQMGAELIGDGSAKADAEMLSLVIEALKNTGLQQFQVTVGQVDYFKGICEAAGLDEETELLLRDYISNKNFFGAEALLTEKKIEGEHREVLLRIADMFGGITSLAEAKELVTNTRSREAICRLEEVYEAIRQYGLESYVSFDLGMLSKYNYYTGIIFKAYTYDVGDAIIKGGRYDNLLAQFGKEAPAVGFVAVIDDLMEALKRQQTEAPVKDTKRYLTFALAKGRLAKKTLELLEEIGITCEEMKDKDSRKLIFVNEELKLKFFLAKGPDVPTYVEYGAADIGVVGKDTLLEENRRVYEVMDLGFGKCRMCVCGPKKAKELLKHHEMIRVASKYPNIAKEYFYNKKHQTVDIIKLNGSVELGPIVGLSDVIVDIVETGSTLKENGLEVLEEICPLSARMIVNQVSMQMDFERIKKLISQLKELCR